MSPAPDKACERCGGTMRGRRPQTRYCSYQCRLDAQVERRRQRLRSEGPPYYLWCQRCQEQFRASRKDALFCSPRCRQASHRLIRRLFGR